MIEYNTRLNNFFGARVVPLQTQISSPVKQEKRFSISCSGKFHEVGPVCSRCDYIDVSHNGNDKCKSKVIVELGLEIKRGKFLCNRCDHTWSTKYVDAELFVQQYKLLISTTVFQLCTFGVSLDKVVEHISTVFSKKISHEWVRQLYIEAAKKIERKNVLQTSGIFNYDEQHLKINGRPCFRVVVLDAVNKDTIFDEIVEEKSIDSLKDKLRMKMLPYKKETFIVDLALGYPEMLKELFPSIKVQLCIFHLNQLITRDFEQYKKLNEYGKRFLPLQESYNQYLMFNLFFNHEVECTFLKRQLKKFTERKEMLKGCRVHEEQSSVISWYEMKLISEFNEFRKGLKKYRRKHKHKYLIRNSKTETLKHLEKLEREICFFPKKAQKRIKKIRKNLDKLTLFQENPLIPPTNNNIEQYYSATLQKTAKKKSRNQQSIELKLKILREKWNKTLGKIKFNFLEFMQLFAKIHHLFTPT